MSLPFLDLINEEDNTLRPPDEIRAFFEKRTKLNGKLVITYCGGGVASTLGALALAIIGYETTMEYDGSLTEWTSDLNRPVETSEP